MSDDKSNQPGGVNALLVVISAPSGGGKTTLAKIIATLVVAMVLVFRPQGLFGQKT